jgi:acetyl-CoA synthetase
MADNAKTAQTAEELEQLLNELGEVDSFAPLPEFRARARITDPDVYAAAARDHEAYWAERARELHWDTPFTKVLDESDAPFVTWFADGTLNASYNCLDRHVEAGLGERVAYHWRGEEGEERAITYADLHRDVQRLANGLKDLGIGKGDVVGIFMPMIPEVVVAMLACARIGAPHNVVFGGFAPDSVRERMEVSHAKALITVDGARRKGRRRASSPRWTGSWTGSPSSGRSWWSATPAPSVRCATAGTSSTTSCWRVAKRSVRPSRCRRSIRCSSCTRRVRRRSRRASCIPPADT